VRPIGAQTSVREAAFFGVNLVCADAGTDGSADVARRMGMISFFIDSARDKPHSSGSRRRSLSARLPNL
jgi:hypothetical protein